MEEEGLVGEDVVVRDLCSGDLEPIIAIDARNIGRRREEYLKLKLREGLAETGIKVSLAAEVEGCLCGFLLARVYYGEFGVMEPVAVLETIGVHPDFHRRGVGAALLRQLRMNLSALRVTTVRTEVSWRDGTLLDFFRHEGFELSERLCLDLDLDPEARRRGSDRGR